MTNAWKDRRNPKELEQGQPCRTRWPDPTTTPHFHARSVSRAHGKKRDTPADSNHSGRIESMPTLRASRAFVSVPELFHARISSGKRQRNPSSSSQTCPRPRLKPPIHLPAFPCLHSFANPREDQGKSPARERRAWFRIPSCETKGGRVASGSVQLTVQTGKDWWIYGSDRLSQNAVPRNHPVGG
jgi:hypothetical protein